MIQKKALIAVNHIGFMHFLWEDIDLLTGMGYKIYVAADNEKNERDTLEMLNNRNVIFIDVKINSKSPLAKANLKSFWSYKKLFKQEKFDLIHCHTPIVGLIVRLAASNLCKKGTKVIYTTHGLAYTNLSNRKDYFIYHTIESFASRFCDAIITINMEDYKNACELHASRVFHINGVGVDIEKYRFVEIDRNEYRQKIGIPIDKIMVLSIGELSLRKNHIIIVNALAQLKNKEHYVFAICGREMVDDGGTALHIKEVAQQKGVNVIFLGFRHDIPQIIHCSDIGAIPSMREGLGLAGIESLSVGIPLVGSDVQGIREYIINGETGYLCHPCDANAFAYGIEKLSDSNIRVAMKGKCLAVAQMFRTAISVQQRKEIYEQILGDIS